MKQKYVITKQVDKNEILIKEYAELDKDILTLVCEESFKIDKIEKEMARGKYPLMYALRTPNMYPPSVYAERIAESVAQLITQQDSNGNSVDLFFDDMELMSRPGEKPIEMISLKMTTFDDDTTELDDLLEDDIEEEFDEETTLPNLNSPLRIADDEILDIEDDG